MRTNTELLDEFSMAWSNHNLDQIVEMFSDNGVFFASSSYGARQRASGREEIRFLTESMFESDDGAILDLTETIVFDNGAFCTWRYVMPSGSVELGCDFFRIENGLIALKDAYRKIGPIVDDTSSVPSQEIESGRER